jgi:hypothetical protein
MSNLPIDARNEIAYTLDMSNTNTYESPAQKVRAALKANGYSSKFVSVKQDGCSVKVTIRSKDVRISDIKAIADTFRDVRYCEGSGEILSGGNTFVDVVYHDDVLAPLVAKILPIVQGAKVPTYVIPGVRVTCHDESEYGSHNANVFTWADGEDCGSFFCVGTAHAAERLAIMALDRGTHDCIGRARIGGPVPIPVANPADPNWLDAVEV